MSGGRCSSNGALVTVTPWRDIARVGPGVFPHEVVSR